MAVDQFGFRIRLDATAAQGGTPSWAAAQNVNASVLADKPFRIRIGVYNNTATATANSPWSIRHSVNGGAYQLVQTGPSAGKPVYVTDATAGLSVDDSAITSALLTPPGGSGAFSSGKYDFTGVITTIGTVGAGRVTEMEFGLALNGAVAVAGDVYTFEVYLSSSPIPSYSQVPSLSMAAAAKNTAAIMMGV